MTTPATPVPTTAVALLDWLTLDPAYQVRSGLDPDAVERYRQAYAEHGPDALPPVTVVEVAGELHGGDQARPDEYRPLLLLVDGWHRVAAMRAAGMCEIRHRTVRGTRTTARMMSCQANRDHGLPLSNAEKRRAVELWLADPALASDTDRAIARALCVSHTLVSTIRREQAEPALATADASADQPATADQPAVAPVPAWLTSPTQRRQWRILAALMAQWAQHDRTQAQQYLPIDAIEARAGETQLKISLRALAKQDLVAERAYGDHHWRITDAGLAWIDEHSVDPNYDRKQSPAFDRLSASADYEAGRAAHAAGQTAYDNPHKLSTTPAIEWAAGWHAAARAAGPAPADPTQPQPKAPGATIVGPPPSVSDQATASTDWLYARAAKLLDRAGGELALTALERQLDEAARQAELRLPDDWSARLDDADGIWGAITTTPTHATLLHDDAPQHPARATSDEAQRLLTDLPDPLPLTTAQALALILAMGLTDSSSDDPTVDQYLAMGLDDLCRALQARLRADLADALASPTTRWGSDALPSLAVLRRLLGLGA